MLQTVTRDVQHMKLVHRTQLRGGGIGRGNVGERENEEKGELKQSSNNNNNNNNDNNDNNDNNAPNFRRQN